MTLVIADTAVMCVALIFSILVKPNIKIKNKSIGTYWVVALLGACLLVLFNCIDLKEIGAGLVNRSSINPIKILVLFLSMTVQSIFLDEVGMFRYCANVALSKARGSQIKLFVYLFLVVSVLTVFTSNDIIILTFTPFICYFSKNARINPIPYLFTEFVAANTWSMALIIGNPTNVYLASANQINFLQYVKTMALPTVFGGVSAFLVLLFIFRKSFKKQMEINRDDYKIEDKPLLYIGISHLAVCTVLLVVSSYIGIDMWLITLCFALSLFIISAIYITFTSKDYSILLKAVRRMPWELIPFVISMFVFVLCFDKTGISAGIGSLLGNKNVILKYGVVSFLTANLVNNIPMSVLFSSVVKALSGNELIKGVYASIVGSNIGAYFTPIGALAGIMWSGILKKHEVEFSFVHYIKYGIMISIPTLLMTLLGLGIVL